MLSLEFMTDIFPTSIKQLCQEVRVKIVRGGCDVKLRVYQAGKFSTGKMAF